MTADQVFSLITALFTVIAALAGLGSVFVAWKTVSFSQMPILYINHLSTQLQNGMITLTILFYNQGSGLAKDIEYFVEGNRQLPRDTFVLPPKNIVSAANNVISFPCATQPLTMNIELRYKGVDGKRYKSIQRMKLQQGTYVIDNCFFDYIH